MEPTHSSDHATVYIGDCLDVMRSLPAGTVDCIITSPPYAMQRASTYGGIPEADYPAWAVSIFDEFRRLLTPTGSIAWNVSPNVRGGMLTDWVLKTRLALREAGWYEHDELAWVKRNKMPTGQRTWPVRSWESIYWYSLTRHPYCNAQANGRELTEADYRNVARRPSPFQGRDVQNGWDHLPPGSARMGRRSRGKNFIILTNASLRFNGPDHPAPFPIELAEWLARFFLPPGGTVLDPFVGSGTTLEAAIGLGGNGIGIDREPAYLDMIRARIQAGETKRAATQANSST